jgi:proline iminopeptidase
MGKASISLIAFCGILLASCQVGPQGAVGPASAGSQVAGPQRDGCIPNDLPAEEGFITAADGARLYYRKLGRGRPVAIYLHGGPGGTMYNGGCEIAPLARHHPLILYDQRGGGRSDTVSEAARLELADHVADLEAIRRHFGLERVTLIGLSWGAGLAAAYADAHPTRVARLLLLSPMPVAKTPFADQRLAAVAEAAGAALMERRQQLSQQLQSATASDEVVALCRQLLSEAPLPYSLNPSRHRSPNGCDFPASVIRNRAVASRLTLQSLGDWDFRPALGRLGVPVLVVEGEKTVVPLASTRLWAASAPSGRLLLVANAGHEVGLDRPRALLRLADTFLRGAWPPGAER